MTEEEEDLIVLERMSCSTRRRREMFCWKKIKRGGRGGGRGSGCWKGLVVVR